MTWSVGSLFASRRSKLLAAASAMVVALFALPLQGTATADPQGQGSTGTLGDGGVLRLHLGSSGTPQDYFGFQKPDPNNAGGYLPIAATDKQSIGNGQGCKIALGTPSLATFSPPSTNNSNPFTGFVSDAIGVGSKSEGNGQPCGRIDSPGQALALRLGDALKGKVIDYAEIDMEGKFSANFRVDGYLVSGSCPPSAGAPVTTSETYNTVGSDSGPDSADGDNYRIRFPKATPDTNTIGATPETLVNCLVFTPTTGGASLEGGADGTAPCDPADATECGGDVDFTLSSKLAGTTDTLFHLVDADGILDCPSGDGPSQATEGDPGEPSSTLDRLENANGEPCTPIPYNLESGPGVTAGCTPGSLQCILLQKDLLGQATQFYWTVKWTPESADYP
ncbi:MAG: hypothetical protein WB297_01310, partial [Actinomycetota bacterium]